MLSRPQTTEERLIPQPASMRSTARARFGAANTSGARKSTGHCTMAPG
ncbi:MAG: hypothetical protein H0U26_02355 [Acidimicrobiia bacterium]|nr:hypothetical protein [Acidimicrobiia bacterium]